MNATILHASKGFLLMLAATLLVRAQAGPPPAGAPAETNALNCAAAGTNGLGPRIQFATKEPNFGRVTKGDTVKYSYIFTNIGDQVLHVLSVQPGCGCTHAGEWTKQVEPGQTGSIPIQLATANFQGDITKFVTVTCDDKSIPNGLVQLMLKGNVWSPVEVIPPYLNFVIAPDAPGGSGVVTITNQLPEPLYLSPPESSNPAFAVELKTNALGRSYQLVVSRVPPLTPGMAQAAIVLKTSLTNPPTVTAMVWANVQQPVSVQPAQLTLAPAPLTNPTSYTINIQNATTNHMALAEPAVSAKDVKVEIKEVQPGRYFNAVLTFPPGFEIRPGEHVDFTVKTTLPHYPGLTVSITQTPRPVVASPAIAPQAALTPGTQPTPGQPQVPAH